MKLFRNRFLRFLLVIGIAVALFYLSIYLREQASNVEVTTHVYVVTKDLEAKHKITNGDITTLEISALADPRNSVKDKALLLNKYVMSPVSKGSFILSSNVSEIENFENNQVPDGMMLFSLPLTIDQAAGWKLEIGHKVDIHYAPFQYTDPNNQGPLSASVQELYKNRVISDVEVVDVLNEALVSTTSKDFSGVPKFVVLMADISSARFISQAKDKGRFDILIKSIE